MNPLELIAALGSLAEPIAQMISLAQQDAHTEEDEAQLLFQIQRAISDFRAKRKFQAGAPETAPAPPDDEPA